jgi:hypothetical protein
MDGAREAVKIVYLLWAPGRPPGLNREILVERCGPRILATGVQGLAMNVVDPESDVRSPAPGNPFERPFCAQVSVWTDRPQDGPFEAILRGAGYRIAAYRVEESVYTDYGGNEHARPRDWPDGVRSPGVMSVTALKRPRRIPRDEWMRRWHGRMSPVSEAIQPRTRYVRNVVLERLSPDGPAYDGIVEEAWPSRRHVEDPFLFFGAKDPIRLAKNMARVLGAVTAFLDLVEIRTVMMGEYFLLTRAS